MYAIERAKQKWCVSLYIPLFSYRVITKIQQEVVQENRT